ncbi:Clp protease ClpP [Sphingobium yanoikuyae]|uniref:ATP-dependent Clp protease proteolytic subunit n=1 Tax=Sphingobium yanoikuyae TaxID=13690 RepID=A0A3G2V0J2_SPHYA|nr:Clp protease ClpP [Sphingobium yanoikuyae]
MQRNSLLAVHAARPPEIANVGSGSDWKFETRALAPDFKRFEVKAATDGNSTISIFDYIGDDGEGGGVSAKRIAAALRQLQGKPVTVEINSPGGNYFEGVAIYNLLRRHDAAVDVEVLGVAASAASVIAMAGDTIAIAANAEIMIHEARGLFLGTKSDMRDAIDTLTHIDAAMCATYAARSGRPASDFAAMIEGKDQYFTGQEAIDAGLADLLMDREAAMPVYVAAAEQFPSDKETLDQFLAKHKMPRSERRELYRAIGTAKPRAGDPDPAMQNAGDDPEPDISPLLAALKV